MNLLFFRRTELYQDITLKPFLNVNLTHTGRHSNSCGKSLGEGSVDFLDLSPKPPNKINSNGWWEMACPVQRQTKWKAQSLAGIGFRMEQAPNEKNRPGHEKTTFYLQLSSVLTDKNTLSHCFMSPPASPSALPSLLPLHPPEKN